MKKVLSFVLVLAMILGSVSMAFAAAAQDFAPATTVVDETNTAVPFADAEDNFVATILKDLGVVDGDGNGNANLADGLTRAEAAALIVKAWGLGDQGAVQTTTKFADVKKTDWFSGYVAVAAANGFVDGSNGKFNPNGKLTMDEAITLVLKAMGYDSHLEGTWPENYRDLAFGLWSGAFLSTKINAYNSGSTKYVQIASSAKVGTQAATRGDLFNLIFNCIYNGQDLVTWKQTAVDGVVSGKFEAATNALNLIEKITRKYSAFSSLNYGFTYVESFAKTKFANKYDGSKYYGQPVVVITKSTKEIGLAKITDVTTVQGTFAKALSDKFATFTAIDGTVYTGLTAKNMSWYVNGSEASTGYSYSNIDKLKTYTLTLICDKTNPTKNASVTAIGCEVVNKTVMINATDVALFAADNMYRYFTPGGIATFNGANTVWNQFTVTDAGVAKNVVLDAKYLPTVEGAATKLSEIQKDDIVELYFAKGANNGKIVKMVVTRNVVTGPITAYSSKNSTYTINGTAYKFQNVNISNYMKYLGADYLDNAVKGASEYAFYLNAAGKVVFSKLTATPEKVTTRYAFVLTAETTDNWTNNGKAWKAASNMAITLLPLDTMVAEEYELISSGALKSNLVSDTDYTWKSVATTTTDLRFVEFTNSGDTLKTLYTADVQVVATTTDLANATVKKYAKSDDEEKVVTFGAAKLEGVAYFKNAKVYTVAKMEDGATYASESAYKLVEVADMKKVTAAGFIYKLDANGYVDTVIVTNYGKVSDTSKKVTLAAIISVEAGADGKLVTYIQPGKDAETLYVATTANITFNWAKDDVTGLYEFELTDGKITSKTQKYGMNDAKTVKFTGDACKGQLGYNGEAIVSDGAFQLALNPTVYFMYLNNNVGANYLVNVTGNEAINAKFEDATAVYVYQCPSYDVVIIDVPAED